MGVLGPLFAAIIAEKGIEKMTEVVSGGEHVGGSASAPSHVVPPVGRAPGGIE